MKAVQEFRFGTNLGHWNVWESFHQQYFYVTLHANLFSSPMQYARRVRPKWYFPTSFCFCCLTKNDSLQTLLSAKRIICARKTKKKLEISILEQFLSCYGTWMALFWNPCGKPFLFSVIHFLLFHHSPGTVSVGGINFILKKFSVWVEEEEVRRSDWNLTSLCSFL